MLHSDAEVRRWAPQIADRGEDLAPLLANAGQQVINLPLELAVDEIGETVLISARARIRA